MLDDPTEVTTVKGYVKLKPTKSPTLRMPTNDEAVAITPEEEV
jgi:hypothetical protein